MNAPLAPRLRDRLARLKPDRALLTSDLTAALTFAVVNVPQAMGHALLAAVNPVLGIFTLMVAVPVGAMFGSSVFMNVSSTAALSVAAGVALVELRFVSNAVMTGFLNGVAALIILGQLGDLTGFASAYSNRVAQALDLLLNAGRIDPWVSVVGAFTLGLIVLALWVKPLQRFAFIVAIAAATLMLALLTLSPMPTAADFAVVPTVGDVASIPRMLPQLALPDLSLVPALLLPAFSVAVIGLVQGAGVSQGTPNPDGRYPNVSRDFFGQGAANVATGLVGGIPAGGSVSGTALIMGAGARSRWANVFVGLFVAAIVLLAAPLVERVPMPALAALLIVAGFQGLRIAQAQVAWKTGRIPRVVMVVTFVATLVVPLQFAVLFGIALSIVLHAVRQSNKVVVTQWVLQAEGFPIEQPPPPRLPSERLTLLHVHGSLFFAAAKNLEEMLQHLRDGAAALRPGAARARRPADARGRRRQRARPTREDGRAAHDRRGECVHGHAAARRRAQPRDRRRAHVAGPATGRRGRRCRVRPGKEA